MSRSKYKGFFINKDLVKKTNKYKIKVFNKKLTIIPEYVDKNAFVYNGINFIFLNIKKEMIGYKFGEFIYTKKKNIFKKKNIKHESKSNTN
jgi:ribosomal protein S19